MDPGRTAIGTWSGGRFMHFGEPIDEERLAALLRPGDGIDTVITADVYGAGEADALLGRALDGRRARRVLASSARSATTSSRASATARAAFPRFTDPRLRGPDEYAGYLRRATERSLERLGVDSLRPAAAPQPRPHRLHLGGGLGRDGGAARRRPDADAIGVAPGPANGFTLDLLDCFERFGDRIDWAMVILNPLEPWPGELCLDAAAEHGVRVITRVVDYGGLFWDDVLPGHEFAEHDHRRFRPDGWVEAGRERLERMRPIAERRRADADAARLPVEPRPRRRSSASPRP